MAKPADPLDMLRVVAAWTFLGVWLLSMILDSAIPSFEVHESVPILAVAAATFLFGLSKLGKGGQ